MPPLPYSPHPLTAGQGSLCAGAAAGTTPTTRTAATTILALTPSSLGVRLSAMYVNPSCPCCCLGVAASTWRSLLLVASRWRRLRATAAVLLHSHCSPLCAPTTVARPADPRCVGSHVWLWVHRGQLARRHRCLLWRASPTVADHGVALAARTMMCVCVSRTMYAALLHHAPLLHPPLLPPPPPPLPSSPLFCAPLYHPLTDR